MKFVTPFLLLLLLSSCERRENSAKESQPAPKPSISDTAKPVDSIVPTKVQNWTYDSTYDKMRNVSTLIASTQSTNQLNFDSPYDGGSIGRIGIRKRGKSFVVYISITKGQILNSYDGIQIPVKFDDKKLIYFRGLEAADYSSDVAFIVPEGKFVSMLQRSKHITIELPFYQEGKRLLEFDVEGLRL